MELRYKFSENIYDGMIHNIFLFKNRDKNLIADVIPKLVPLKVKKGDYIYKKGMQSNSVFILFRGRVVFTTPRNSIFRHFVEGSYFGEIEIFKNCTRQFSVLAIKECELMELSRENFYTIMKDFPEFYMSMECISRNQYSIL